MRTAIVGLLCAPLVSLAQAPLEFKGVPLGAPRATFFQSHSRLDCGQSESCFWSSSDFGRANFTFAGRAPKYVAVRFRDGQFAEVRVTFDAAWHSIVLGAYSEKYGKPTKVETSTLTTRAGVETRNTESTWTFADGSTILIRHYAGSLDDGQVTIRSRAGVLGAEAEEAERLAKAKKDI